MFNLIVAVLSIALIGITAGASVYYGGAAFEGSNNRARAASLIATGGQLAAAQQLYMAENGGKRAVSKYHGGGLARPENLTQSGIQILIDNRYLDAVPAVPTNLDFIHDTTKLPQWQIDTTGTIAYIRLSDYVDDAYSSEASTKKLCHDVYEAGGAYILQNGVPAATTDNNPNNDTMRLYGRDGELINFPRLNGHDGAYEPQGTDLDIANGHVVPGFLPGNQVTFACITKPWGNHEGGLKSGRYFVHRI